MHTSWRRHRRHAVAQLAFRAAAATGFAAGLAVALIHSFPAPRTCDIQHAQCLTAVLRYEALAHVAPPAAGLVAGMVLGAWLSQSIHRAFARSNLG
jgi:hypothetical protein